MSKQELIENIKNDLVFFIGEDSSYTQEEKQNMLSVVSNMKDDKLLELYLVNHEYQLETITKMMSEIHEKL